MREDYVQEQIRKKIYFSLTDNDCASADEVATFTNEDTFESIGCDDIDMTLVEMDLEAEFDLDLENIDMGKKRTLGDVVNLVHAVIVLVTTPAAQ